MGTVPNPAPPQDPFQPILLRAELMRALVPYAGDHKKPGFSRVLTKLLWANQIKRFPRWWRDVEVADFIVASHREATIDETIAQMEERFGVERTPSRSALGRLWVRIDELQLAAAARTR